MNNKIVKFVFGLLLVTVGLVLSGCNQSSSPPAPTGMTTNTPATGTNAP